MPCLFVARFDSVPSAKSAAHALIAEGFQEEAVRLFLGGRHSRTSGPWELSDWGAVWPTLYHLAWRVTLLSVIGAAIGTFFAISIVENNVVMLALSAVGACSGAILGACWAARWLVAWRLAWLQRVRESGVGVLLAVHAEPEDQKVVVSLLQDAGGFQIDHEYGQWSEGRWVESEATPRTRVPRGAKGPRHTQWQL